MNLFTHCIITASDEPQAEAFRALLKRRIDHGLYPREISFHVYADPPGRVGSGGGTLWALHRLYSETGVDPERHLHSADAPSVLVLNAAGESRRLPVYAPEGKLFAPLPVPSSSLLPPVVLDLQLSLYLRFPWTPGMAVVGSGDVIIDFDTDALAPLAAPITGFAAPAPFEQGSRHGVFAFDQDFRHLTDYFQKQPVAFLANHARIEGTESCALDIGIVAMNAGYQAALFALANEVSSGTSLMKRIETGDVRFGLYLEQLTASLGSVDESEYLKRVSDRSELSRAELSRFHHHLNTLKLGGRLTRNCTFLHFGSVREFPAAAAALITTGLKPFYSFFEAGELLPASSRDDVIVEGFEGEPSIDLPAGFCLDARNTPSGRVIALYHADDSFRPSPLQETRFCDRLLTEWLDARGLSPEDVGIATAKTEVDLRRLPLFPRGDDTEFVRGYLKTPEDTEAWKAAFLKAERFSIHWLNENTDPLARDAERLHRRTQQLAAQLTGASGWRSVSGADLALVVSSGAEHEALAGIAEQTADPLLRQYRRATLAGTRESQRTTSDRRVLRFLDPGRWEVRARGVKSDQIVWARSPVRFDLGGGWSDTPPYTNLFGGAVTNIAANLNGQPPIQVFVRPTVGPEIVFHSIDLGERELVTRGESLREFDDPTVGFALPRAACALLGLAEPGLSDRLRSLGGGFEISLLAAVPKGSGLGTSSILGGVILAALFRFFGLPYTLDDLFVSVLELEQMLTTGGGWQDQIGGLAGGVKYIQSRPGTHPAPLVHQLDPFLFEEPEFRNRMTVYYTGVTRLARNILQQVVHRVNLREPAYLFTHATLPAFATRARKAVELRDYASLASTVAGSWRANKLIHESSTNEEVEDLLEGVRPFYRAAKLLGAGGGGYALFMSDSVDDADQLRDQLAHRSAASPVARLVDFSLSRTGLEVSVS